MPGKQRQKHLRWTPPAQGAGTASLFDIPTHDPPLAPRDEAVFLLHTGAEIEHALLVQYLYAAYSLRPAKEVDEEHAPLVRAWRKTLLGIAREEMGHLITVQNLLKLIGGPIILDREDYPFLSSLYPFHFRLEPLSKRSLAKYVLAEMPHIEAPTEEIGEIIERVVGDGQPPVNRVGAIYLRIAHLFSEGSRNEHLQDSDFNSDAANRQAHWEEWGNGGAVLVPEARTREEALIAIEELAEQ